MPKVPIDYSKTCIYKLVHKDDINNEYVYIGSTSNFAKRKDSHKSSCTNSTSQSYNNPKYTYIRDNGGWDNWVMVEIEKFPCNDKREAETRERYWIEFYKSKLNSIVPTRTNAEYYQDNLEYYVAYRNENRDKIKEKCRKYNEINREELQAWQRQYHHENKEKIKEYKTKYYQDNKEKINQKQKEKIICQCGCEVSKKTLLRHQRTTKHLQLLNSSKEIGTNPQVQIF